MEDTKEIPLKKTRNKTTIWLNNPTTGHISKENIIEKVTSSPIFIVALFIKARTRKQGRCPLIDEWIKKLWHIHTGKYLLLFSCTVMSDSLWPMDCSTPGFPVLHHLPDFAQTYVHWVDDAIHPSHPLSSPSPPALSLSQDQDLFPWVSSAHQVVKVLELQPQHQSFQWIFMVDFF